MKKIILTEKQFEKLIKNSFSDNNSDENIDESLTKKIGTALIAGATALAPLGAQAKKYDGSKFHKFEPVSYVDTDESNANKIFYNAVVEDRALTQNLVNKIKRAEGGDTLLKGLFVFAQYANYYNNQYTVNKQNLKNISRKDYIKKNIQNVSDKILFKYRLDGLYEPNKDDIRNVHTIDGYDAFNNDFNTEANNKEQFISMMLDYIIDSIINNGFANIKTMLTGDSNTNNMAMRY